MAWLNFKLDRTISHLYMSLGHIQMAKENSISLPNATSLALAHLKISTITAYQVGKVIFTLFLDGEVDGRPLAVRKPLPERRHYLEVLNFLLSHGVLHPARGLSSSSVYSLIGAPDPEAHELLCIVDPYAYLSHLSAMAIHGLTDRMPHTIFGTSPAPSQWRALALERMHQDLGTHFQSYLDVGFPQLTRVKFDRILGQPVHWMHSQHAGAFKKLEPRGIRVSTLGRTFLDMLREPNLCGGIHHVLDVYRAHARTYLALIIGEVEQHGSAIDKVRAGYVLEEVCSLQAREIEGWVREARRGGSRRLVAQNPYSSTYSAKWCLSLNAD
jgi:predicted transcriptional regulator of viral defense system